MKKNLLLVAAALVAILAVTILLPSALVAIWPSKSGQEAAPGKTKNVPLQVDDEPNIRVYLTEQQKVVTMPLEQYVRGVVAAEMPATFQEEALKAQAIAARTYMVHKLLQGDKSTDGADVSDSHTESQEYSTDDKLKQNWGADYDQNSAKINQAVNATKGEIALYNGQPIEAFFFSTSSGATENSEDYWGTYEPYLRSVPSPWDEKSPKFSAEQQIPLDEFSQKLGLGSAVTAANATAEIKPLDYSDTDHITKISVGGKTFSGAEFRTRLGLRSTDFTWKVVGDNIVFDTKGYGHDVGLSQFGADGMAQEGKKAEDIIKYYYKGVSIGHVQDVLPKK